MGVQSKVLTVVMAAAVLSAPSFASARMAKSSYPSDGENPLRIVYHFVAPVGKAIEWTVTRPIEAIGSVVSPYDRVAPAGYEGCSRERPARSCTDVIK